MLKRWVIAFSKSLVVHLREDGSAEAELKVRHRPPKLRRRQKNVDRGAPILEQNDSDCHRRTEDARRCCLEVKLAFFVYEETTHSVIRP
jgi:hypothetical protein